MRIFLVTDAWEPQLNGVVRTLTRTVSECRAAGHDLEVVQPGDGFKTMPLPTYPDIPLSILPKRAVEKRFRDFEPEAVHIATEGTLGLAARAVCLKHRFPFTTSYHTKFPEYVNARFPIPVSWGYAYMRWFHGPAGRVMVATPSMRDELGSFGIKHVVPWARGVDTEQFNPSFRAPSEAESVYGDLPRPIQLYVGRVAVEKNLEAFLDIKNEGTKVIVGDGPQMAELKAKYPDAVFPGAKFGDDLSRYFADADVFVFPSWTDTFGLVILESMACGTPVAAYKAPGPRDIIPGSNAGAVGDDLAVSIAQCLTLERDVVRRYAEGYSWKACAEDFMKNLSPLPPLERKRFWQRIRLHKRSEAMGA